MPVGSPAALADICRTLAELVPVSGAEPWDNVGLLCGEPAQAIERLLVCTDYDERVAAGVAAAGYPLASLLIVAYHPPWFEPCRRLVGSGPLASAVRGGAAIYSLHTAFDAVPSGPNAHLGTLLGLHGLRPLEPLPPPAAPDTGRGRVGHLAAAVPLSAFVAHLKAALTLEHVMVCSAAGALGPWPGASGGGGEGEPPVKTVAIAVGAGRSLWPRAQQRGADVLVTGELPHHDALAARRAGLRVVALGHARSERPALVPLVRRLEACFHGIPVTLSAEDRDPWVVA